MNEREKEREKEREQHPFFTPTQRIVARRLPMHTYRKRRTRSSIQGDSERREVGAPTLRKQRLKPDVSAGLRAVSSSVYRLHQTAHYSSLLCYAVLQRKIFLDALLTWQEIIFLFFHRLCNIPLGNLNNTVSLRSELTESRRVQKWNIEVIVISI